MAGWGLHGPMDTRVQHSPLSVHPPRHVACKEPRFFVYDLPQQYRHKGSWTGAGHGLPVAPLAGTPDAATTVGVKLHHTLNYGTAASIYERALRHSCRVTEPSRAELFLVPVFTDTVRSTAAHCAERNRTTGKCKKEALFERLRAVSDRAGVPYVQRRSGLDHILLTPKSGLPSDSITSQQFRYDDHRLGAALRFAVEERLGAAGGWAQSQVMYRSIPWASSVHMPLSTRWAELPWRIARPRPNLVAAAFVARPSLVKDHKYLRFRLNSSCARHTSLCARLSRLPQVENTLARSRKKAALRTQFAAGHDPVLATAALYLRSLYCMQSPCWAQTVRPVLPHCFPCCLLPGGSS